MGLRVHNTKLSLSPKSSCTYQVKLSHFLLTWRPPIVFCLCFQAEVPGLQSLLWELTIYLHDPSRLFFHSQLPYYPNLFYTSFDKKFLQKLNFSYTIFLLTALILWTWLSCATDSTLSLPSSLIHPIVWGTSSPTHDIHITPVLNHLKHPSVFVCVPHYPIIPKHQWGLKPKIHHLFANGFLKVTHSPCNTPIVPVLKYNGSFT